LLSANSSGLASHRIRTRTLPTAIPCKAGAKGAQTALLPLLTPRRRRWKVPEVELVSADFLYFMLVRGERLGGKSSGTVIAAAPGEHPLLHRKRVQPANIHAAMQGQPDGKGEYYKG